MWEMQTLTSTPTQSPVGDQNSPNGVTDMDTSNDERTDLEALGMDFSGTADKSDSNQSSTNNDSHHQTTVSSADSISATNTTSGKCENEV